MRMTWREWLLITVTIAAVLVERAYFHSWELPLAGSLNWALLTIMVLGLASFCLGFVLDKRMRESIAWSTVTYLCTILAATLSALGALTGDADYLILLTILVIGYSVASLVGHLFAHSKGMSKHTL